MSRRDLSARARVVFDPFAGSGSTIIAAEKVGRQAFCIEIDARYVDTAVRRNERPATPFWESTGQTFDELAAQHGGRRRWPQGSAWVEILVRDSERNSCAAD